MKVLIDLTTREKLSRAEETARFMGVLGYRTDPNFDLSPYGAAWADVPTERPQITATQVAYLSDVAEQINGAWQFRYIIEERSADERAMLIRGEANRRLRALAANYDDEERETWATQVSEAKAVKAGATDAPMLSVFADKRGITLDAMADRVLMLSAQFAAASAVILARRDTLLEMAETPTDFEADTWWA